MRSGLWFLAVCVVAVLLSSCGSSSASTRSGSSSTVTTTSSSPEEVNKGYSTGLIKIRKRRQFTQEEMRERKKPSEIPGLTAGQLEDMPEVPELPRIFGLNATQEQLDAHAMIMAREDVQSGRADLVTIEQRYTYIRYVWTRDWQDRKALYSSVIDDQGNYAKRLRRSAALDAAWERSYVEREDQHKRDMVRIERDELPVLTPEERRLIGD